MPGWSVIRAWVLWVVVLLAVTVVMHSAREDMEQAHVVLVYLLVVLGGSVSGGRSLGLAIACAGFILIDYYFQPPYDTLSVGKPLDWLVLLAFLATAAVTTQLLTLARTEAAEAKRRAQEIGSLARLGSEALNAGPAEEALAKIAQVIRTTLGVEECEIHRWDGSQVVPGTSHRSSGDGAEPSIVDVSNAVTLTAQSAGPEDQPGAPTPGEVDPRKLDLVRVTHDGASSVLVPLTVHSRTVGVLRLTDSAPISVDAEKRRFLAALAYYAALGVERVALVAEAEHAEALREADRLRDVLIASLSHDLRTPLTAIKAAAQQQKGHSEGAEIIVQQADVLSRLVGDLLDWSRIKAGAFPLSLELNTADDLLGAVTRQFSDRATLKIDIDWNQPALVGRFDFLQALRILTNLVENALRYSPLECAVELGVRRERDALLFTVSDRGPGVALAERERIFEPFYRPVAAIPDAARAGLGLSIARQLAEIQGGALTFSVRPDGGSVFTLRLPAADVSATLGEASL